MARKKSKTVEKAKVKLKCNLVALNSKGIALKGKWGKKRELWKGRIKDAEHARVPFALAAHREWERIRHWLYHSLDWVNSLPIYYSDGRSVFLQSAFWGTVLLVLGRLLLPLTCSLWRQHSGHCLRLLFLLLLLCVCVCVQSIEPVYFNLVQSVSQSASHLPGRKQANQAR